MEMKPLHSGKLRAIGYDARTRLLQIRLDNGDTLQYSGVGEDPWRRLSSSGAAWSFYRDNIEEEFTVKNVLGVRRQGRLRWKSCLARNDGDAALSNCGSIKTA